MQLTSKRDERRQRLRQARDAAIERLAAEGAARGELRDRAYWSLVYDLELAPVTTNRRQLEELGVPLPSAESLDDAALAEALWRVIEGLAEVYTFLVNTDHLTDRELYSRLVGQILDEPLHEIVEGSGGQEYIDLRAAGAGPVAEHSGQGTPRRRDHLLPRPGPRRPEGFDG